MTQTNLGSKVTMDQLKEEEDLPFPGNNDPFAAAESFDAPFNANQAKTKNKTPPAKPTQELQKPGKESSQLKRFREAFGRKRIEHQTHKITREINDEKIEMSFQLRAIGHEDAQWAINKTVELGTTGVMDSKLAYVAISVCAMDEFIEEGKLPTPLYEVFGVEIENSSQIKDPYYPSNSIRFEAANLFIEELRTSLFDVVEELFLAVELLIDGQTKAKEQEKTDEAPLV